MSEPRQTLRPEYFDALDAVDPDPWKFAASSYERAKYTLTLCEEPKGSALCCAATAALWSN
jgi:hypothetical protein